MPDPVPARQGLTVAVIGGGPAGLMAADILSAAGVAVTLYDRMPAMGRKLLMAGRGGLNLTHSEPFENFVEHYGGAAPQLRPMLEAFPPKALIGWAEALGQPTFIGSSGRVFPKTMKASPLLRAWLARLAQQNVAFRPRHDWLGWGDSGALLFRDAAGEEQLQKSDATVLALGGASWPRLGSNGAWTEILARHGVEIAPLKPANCGFTMGWSEAFRSRFAGQPLKNIALHFGPHAARGDAVITSYGIEGGVVYALSSPLREAAPARATIDLRPDMSNEVLLQKLDKPRGKDSLTNFLRKTISLSPLEFHLLREALGADFDPSTDALAKAIKNLPLFLQSAQPLARAISTAGGVAFSALDGSLQLKAMPCVYVAGEMLDWEAPTGGYLMQGCFATAVHAAHAILRG